MALMAGATTLGDLAGAIGIRAQQSAIVAELKAGSEDAYAWLIGEFHQPIYSLVHRIVADPADAADTTQEVFLKVFRGMKHFHGESSLKTWIYRIAVHEASNRRRWWFRHKAKETSIEPNLDDCGLGTSGMRDALMDESESPFDMVVHEEVRARVEEELRQISEPYRTTVILRDLEEMSYEEIAEITDVSLGTVKSRLTRGREALRRRLTGYVMENGEQLGLQAPGEVKERQTGCVISAIEVTR
jgi:RNA polymerase sigma-70 factor (ECF subfamily)